MDSNEEKYPESQVRNALLLWTVFFAIFVVLNGTVPFMLGMDLQEWTASQVKRVLVFGIVYAGLFFFGTLTFAKGWNEMRHPRFLIPALLGTFGIFASAFIPEIAILGVATYTYLAAKFGLRELGFRSHGLKGDIVAVILFGVFSLLPLLFRTGSRAFTPGNAALAMITRLLFNPASTAENVFYFGFLTDRLSQKTGNKVTPFIIGIMYTLHEMSNPEYWYGGMNFIVTFLAIVFTTVMYLWRRNTIAVWLGDGCSRFVANLFT